MFEFSVSKMGGSHVFNSRPTDINEKIKKKRPKNLPLCVKTPDLTPPPPPPPPKNAHIYMTYVRQNIVSLYVLPWWPIWVRSPPSGIQKKIIIYCILHIILHSRGNSPRFGLCSNGMLSSPEQPR